MIKGVVIQGKTVLVRYDSELWRCYMKAADIPPMLGGVRPLPKSVINFMRMHPNKVR